MTIEELVEVIEDLLRSQVEDEDDATELRGAKITSFRRAGVITRDAGFTIELVDGSEYEVTIVQSRSGRDVRCEECGKEISSEEIAAYRREAADPDGLPAVCDDCAEDENAP